MDFRRVIRMTVTCLLLAAAFAAPSQIYAQEVNTCTATVREAATQTLVNCSGSGLNTACYAFDEIERVLVDPLNEDDEVFSEPGDVIQTADVITLRPSAINTEDETWGITVLHLQAGLPSGFEDNVIVVGLGGAEIESGVPIADAFVPLEEPVSLTTIGAGELRVATTFTVPDESEVLGTVPAGAAVLADAVSEDGAWVRVIVDEAPGWLAASAVDSDDLAALPAMDDGQLTALQSFYTRTGIDAGSCLPRSSWVIVQGPEATPVDVVINDVPIRIESTIAVRTLEAGEPIGLQMEVLVLYGVARANPDTQEEIIIPPGYTVTVGYGPDFVSKGIEGDDDERSGPLSIGEPTVVDQSVLDDIGIIEELPADLFNYEVPPPIIITPSGIGGPIIELIFTNPGALAQIQQLCSQGIIPVAICQVFGFPTP
ncbi:MAG: hypothetical protein IPM16_10625 [Chloroflexi bacterium]|nr:hypothetical protein [Chloroflexota bacterium]